MEDFQPGRRSADREGRRAADDLPVGRRADAAPAVLRVRRLRPARAARRARSSACWSRRTAGSSRNDRAFAETFKASGAYASLQFDTLQARRLSEAARRRADRHEDEGDRGHPGARHPDRAGADDLEGRQLRRARRADQLRRRAASSARASSSSRWRTPATAATATTPRPAGHRLTMPEVHELIEAGTGWLKKEHFHPVPCSHPSCYTATYLFRMNDGRYVPLPDFVDVRQYLDAMANHDDHPHRRPAREDDPRLDHRTCGRRPRSARTSEVILASLKTLPQGHVQLAQSARRPPRSSAAPRRARRRSSSTRSWTRGTSTSRASRSAARTT